MIYDDDALERALAALPMEEPPADLRARILLAAMEPPRPVFRTWELWVIGAALALCTWLIMVIVGSPAAVSHAVAVVASSVDTSSVVWLGVGALAALAVSLSETALRTLHRAKP